MCSRNRSHLKVYGGSSHPELTRSVARKVGVSVGEVKLSRFSNRETDVQLLENVRGQDVYVMQSGGSLTPNDDLMELLLLINAFRLAAAGEITVITPFFPYSKGDQKDGNRVPIASKLVANLLKKAGATYVMLLDPHTPQMEGFFDMPVDAVKMEPIFCEWIKRNVPDWEDCVVVSPDEGGTKRSINVANDLQLDFALIHNRNKVREEKRTKKFAAAVAAAAAAAAAAVATAPVSATTAAAEDGEGSSSVTDDKERFPQRSCRQSSDRSSSAGGSNRMRLDCLSGDVEGRRVIVIDDMIDTGKTLKFAAEVLEREGASELYFIATHGVFSSGSIDTINELQSNILKAVVVSNSIPQQKNKELLQGCLHVVDISGLLAEFIRRHHYRESVSVLSQFMPIRDEHHHSHARHQFKLSKELLRDLRLDDLASSDPAEMEDEDEEGEEGGEEGEGGGEGEEAVSGEDHPDGAQTSRKIQKLRKGFRLSSMCWD